ncbi:MAG: hypothetical protein F7B17_01935 [Desulfurococcales archaeon]|nr:hypothetical protein [Desulfurococcales archaeon]
MQGKGYRKGLSPLIASVILIAITIVGGLLVYQYFQVSSESLIAAGETVFLRVSYTVLDNGSKLVYIEVTNGYRKPISVLDVQYYDIQGGEVAMGLQLNTTVKPGGKTTITTVVPEIATAVAVVYSIDGQVLVSEPVQLG